MYRNQNWARRDAEASATPLFPASGRMYRASPFRTTPPASRYQPVMTAGHAIERIIDQADLIRADGRRWLMVEMTPPLEDFLVIHGAAREDFEDGGDDEADLGV